MHPPIEKLSDLNAAIIESATAIATYEDALSSAIRYTLDMDPTSIHISFSCQKRGFVIVHDGYVDTFATELLANGTKQTHPLEVLSTMTVVSRIGAAKKTFMKCVSFGEVTRLSCLSQEMPSSVTVHNLFWNVPVRFKVLENCLSNKSKVFVDLKLIVQKYALVHSLIRWTLQEESESASSISIIAGNGNLMNRFLKTFRQSCETPIFVCLNHSDLTIEGLCWSWTERYQFRIQQFYFNDFPVDIPSFADLFQRCALSTRENLKLQISTSASFIITIKAVPTILRQTSLYAQFVDENDISPALNQGFREFLFSAYTALYPTCEVPLKIRKIIEATNIPETFRSYEALSKYRHSEIDHSKKTFFNNVLHRKYNDKRTKAANSFIEAPFEKRFCNRNEIFQFNTLTAVSNFEVKFHRDMISRAEVLNQVENKFIIAKIPYQQRNLVVAVDQHAADERIKLEMFENQIHLAFVENRIDRLVLSQAIVLDWSADDALAYEFHKELIKTWGFQVTKLPSEKICLQGCPSILGETLTECDLLDFVRLLHREGAHTKVQPPKLQSILASKACRSAIKFGVHMEKSDCNHMLEKLSLCRFPFQCAHGRPSMIPIGIFGISH